MTGLCVWLSIMTRVISYPWMQWWKARALEFNHPHSNPGPTRYEPHCLEKVLVPEPLFPRLHNGSNNRTYSDRSCWEDDKVSHNLLNLSTFLHCVCFLVSPITTLTIHGIETQALLFPDCTFCPGNRARLEETLQYRKPSSSGEIQATLAPVQCCPSSRQVNETFCGSYGFNALMAPSLSHKRRNNIEITAWSSSRTGTEEHSNPWPIVVACYQVAKTINFPVPYCPVALLPMQHKCPSPT